MTASPAKTANDPITPAERAAKVVDDLRGRRQSIIDRISANAKRRSAISYDAVVDGSVNAKKELADLTNSTVTLECELESLSSAAAVAEEKLQAVLAEEQQVETRKSAYAARLNYKKLGENGAVIQQHLLAAAMLLEDSKRLSDENHTLGFAFPNWHQWQANVERAISTWLMSLPIRRDFEHRFLSPTLRITMERLFSEWSINGVRQIDAKFGAPFGGGYNKQKENADAT